MVSDSNELGSNVRGNTPRMPRFTHKHPLRRGTTDELMALIIICPLQTSSGHWYRLWKGINPKDVIGAVYFCSLYRPQPGNDAQEIVGESRAQVVDGVLPGHKDSTQLAGALQAESQKSSMIDCGLLDEGDVGSVIGMS